MHAPPVPTLPPPDDDDVDDDVEDDVDDDELADEADDDVDVPPEDAPPRLALPPLLLPSPLLAPPADALAEPDVEDAVPPEADVDEPGAPDDVLVPEELPGMLWDDEDGSVPPEDEDGCALAPLDDDDDDDVPPVRATQAPSTQSWAAVQSERLLQDAAHAPSRSTWPSPHRRLLTGHAATTMPSPITHTRSHCLKRMGGR